MKTEPLNLATAAENFDIDPSLTDDDQGLYLPMDDNGAIPSHADIDDATATAITASLAEASQHIFAPAAGDEYTPITDPIIHAAPFIRPNRDEHTPYPEHLVFPARERFEIWLSGESSWCHYVQRRTTTPEKRAEERMRARLKAHERALAVMSPEEAASTPPLKKRRRLRTSPILEKITYTCHHAGSYESKHSTSLPHAKLRLNTKKSVKCNCNSRIVLTEMQDGECRAAYFWKHQGHDPFAEDELESGRLPKIIDAWLNAQIEAGKDTESIRKLLQMTDEEKAEYLETATIDPTSVPTDMPPPLALSLKVKYPDIYNRYRKLKGPIKATKPLKTRRAAANRSQLAASSPLQLGDSVKPEVISGVQQGAAQHFDENGVGLEIDPQMTDELAILASQGHADLAQALSRLPRQRQYVEHDQLDDAMLTMTEGDPEGVKEEKSETAWK